MRAVRVVAVRVVTVREVYVGNVAVISTHVLLISWRSPAVWRSPAARVMGVAVSGVWEQRAFGLSIGCSGGGAVMMQWHVFASRGYASPPKQAPRPRPRRSRESDGHIPRATFCHTLKVRRLLMRSERCAYEKLSSVSSKPFSRQEEIDLDLGDTFDYSLEKLWKCVPVALVIDGRITQVKSRTKVQGGLRLVGKLACHMGDASPPPSLAGGLRQSHRHTAALTGCVQI